jgi:CrcB protein
VTAVLFAVAAGLGAATRLRVNQYGWTWLSTLAVNLVGSFLLGWLVASGPTEGVATVVGTGYLGSLTTFSMFAIEATEGSPRRRITIIAANLVGGLLLARLGMTLG